MCAVAYHTFAKSRTQKDKRTATHGHATSAESEEARESQQGERPRLHVARRPCASLVRAQVLDGDGLN